MKQRGSHCKNAISLVSTASRFGNSPRDRPFALAIGSVNYSRSLRHDSAIFFSIKSRHESYYALLS